MTKINFIHIPKNAGMSVRHADILKNKISVSTPNNHKNKEYTNSVLSAMNRYNEHHGYEHARWRDLNEKLRENTSFAIIRNPWSKVVSRYTFLKILFKNNNKGVLNNKNYKDCTFEEFIEERHIWGNIDYFWHRAIKGWYQQLDHVTDENNTLRCDVLRFEHFNEDIQKYFNLKKPLRLRNVSNIVNIDYKTFYTPTTQKIIGDWYGSDIEFFGFKYDGTATKNIWNV